MGSGKMLMVVYGLLLQTLTVESCSKTFNEIASLKGQICTGKIVWTEDVLSIIACVYKCQNEDQCTGVFFKGATRTCKATSYFYTHGPTADCQQNIGWKYLVPDADCQEWRGSVVVVPNYRISEGNLQEIAKSTLEDCKERCLQREDCKSADFSYNSLKCYLNQPSALSDPQIYDSYVGTYYIHKNCKCTSA